jgi:hypothetical protein
MRLIDHGVHLTPFASNGDYTVVGASFLFSLFVSRNSFGVGKYALKIFFGGKVRGFSQSAPRARRNRQTANGIGWLSVEDEVAKSALDPPKPHESRREKTSVS